MIIWHDRVASTMNAAHALAAAGAPHGAGIAALEQVAGRGRRGRRWASPRGGLWLSVVCRPSARTVPDCLSLRIGLAVADALERTTPSLPPLQLKWPNDLILHDRKVGGILCEARWDAARLGWVVVGIGLNVTNALPLHLAATAVRVADFDPAATPERLAEPVAAAIAAAADLPGPLTATELDAFGRRDWLLDRRLIAPRPGLAAGITADGALLVEHDGVRVPIPVTETVTAE